MITTSMKLADTQAGCRYRRDEQGRILPQIEGEVALCENLRENITGRLDAIAGPRRVAEISHQIVAVDVRGEMRWLFSLTEDNELRLAGTFDSDNQFTTLDKALCTLRQGVKGYASTGAFLVLMLDDGTLFYLLWDYLSLSYSVLGGLPVLPAVGAEAQSVTTFERGIEAMTFKESVEDMRAGVPTEVTERIDKNLRSAWQAAVDAVHSAGMWVQPVQMRLAYRLWDGRLLHVSEPITIGVGYQGYERVELPLTGDETGFTGTSSATLSIKGYRIGLQKPTWDSSAWSDVIAAVEVWISREQEVVDATGGITVSQVQTTSGYQLSALLPTTPETELTVAMSDSLVGRHSAYDDYSDMADILQYVEKVTYKSEAPKEETFVSNARLLHGRGDFLHLVSGNELFTMRRGNPLAVASQTVGVGGEIFAISSQCVGGGAYTRQFIYLFTDHGIVALTHKPDGTHTNCRIISPVVVGDDRKVVATSSGVYALSTVGELLLIRDAKVMTVISGIADCRQLAWDSRTNELWLIPSTEPSTWSRSIVLQIVKDYRAYLSTILPQKVLYSEGNFIFTLPTDTPTSLYDLIDCKNQPLLPVRWVSAPIAVADKRVVEEIVVGVEGDDTDCTIEVSKVSASDDLTGEGHASQMLVKADVTGKVVTPVRLRLLPPTIRLRKINVARHYRISLQGHISTLSGVRLL